MEIYHVTFHCFQKRCLRLVYLLARYLTLRWWSFFFICFKSSIIVDLCVPIILSVHELEITFIWFILVMCKRRNFFHSFNFDVLIFIIWIWNDFLVILWNFIFDNFHHVVKIIWVYFGISYIQIRYSNLNTIILSENLFVLWLVLCSRNIGSEFIIWLWCFLL